MSARLRYSLAAILAVAAVYSGIQVVHVEANMQQVTNNFESDRSPN
ncbi:MAG: hypothetical protein JHC98_11800 [Thermoleophilaceae bacterium]|nr:hypothetical protein [Thermoleophilaceae bacterium]